MKQTAVEWLEEKIWKLDDQNYTVPQWLWEDVEQAKRMEKQQIIDAFHRGYANAISVPNKEYNPEKYYNEKFNK
jgi:hypothetical protein